MNQARVGLLVAAALVAMPATALAQPKGGPAKAAAGKSGGSGPLCRVARVGGLGRPEYGRVSTLSPADGLDRLLAPGLALGNPVRRE